MITGCFTGVTQTIGGIECYVSTPTGDYPKDKVVLFLTDVFGIPLINNRVRSSRVTLGDDGSLTKRIISF